MAAIFTKQSGIRAVSVGADAHIGPLGSYEFAEDFRKKRYILRADRVVRPYGIRVHRGFAVGADDSVRPMRSYEFAEDFSKTGASCRVDVGIDPYNAYRRCIKNSELLQVPREKSRKTEGVFLVALRDSVGKSKSSGSFSFASVFFWRSKRKC